jgi:hypothetical protein
MRSLLLALLVLGCDKEPGAPKAAAKSQAESTTAPAAAPLQGWFEADPQKPLAGTLAEQAALAVKAGKKPHAYLHADWCEPCNELQKYKGDPKMTAAFAGTHIIMIDIDRVKDAEIKAAGMSSGVIPAFYRLDDTGKPTGAKIDGGAWGDNIPENMAPPLATFFAQ